MRRDARSYVTRAADAQLLQALLDGEFCYILTARQMGKSSLMVRTAVRLQEKGVATVLLDLTKFGNNVSPEQWYVSLLDRVGRELKLEDELEAFWDANSRMAPVVRFMKALREVVLEKKLGNVVIFLDEIDAVRSLPFKADELFAAIRSIYNERTTDPALKRLTFALFGVVSPSELISDVNITPFNIGLRIELVDFTLAEAAPLAEGLGAKAPMERILYWTDGHPYLTQKVAETLRDSPSGANETPGAAADRAVEKLFFASSALDSEDNLKFVGDRMLRGSADKHSLLALYSYLLQGKTIRNDETDPQIEALKLSGIARNEDGKLKVRNRVYAHAFDKDWIKRNTEDAEIRRQKEAKKRGFIQAAAIAIPVILALLGISAAAFLFAHEANLEKEKAYRITYDANMQLTQQTFESANNTTVASVLSDLEKPEFAKFRGYEWDYWQQSSISTLWGHLEVITSIAFAPDGKRIVTGSNDKTAKVWDVATGRETFALKGHTDGVTSVAFSPDGKRIVTGSSDKMAKVWDAGTGQETLALKGHKAAIFSVAFSPDGKRIVTGSVDKTAKMWDLHLVE